jgi:hypothetical protein
MVKIIEMDYLNGCLDIYSKGMIPFERSFASHPKSKYWSERNEKKPNEVYKCTRDAYWFDCDTCHHSFEIVLYRISSNAWCQYCSHTILCKDNDCITCYNHSFASHPKSKYWSDKNEENPRCVFKNSNTKYLFNCDKCNHQNMIRLNAVYKGRWCPYCSIPCKKICNDRSCSTCHEHSFYSHYRSLYWSRKNKVHPRDVIKSSAIKYWFLCHECNHEFKSSLDHVSNKDTWCPYCAHLKLCESNNCTFCFNNSLASFDKIKYLSKDTEINPRMIFKFNKIKLKFNCNMCSTPFISSAHHVVNGSWCSTCKKKTETKLYKWLLSKYDNILSQIKYDWCKNHITGKFFSYDFEIGNNILIELDGLQHFQQVSNWQSPEIQQERDKYKIKCALENGKNIIHIYQDDVLHDKNNWEKRLEKIINKLLISVKPTLEVIGIDKDHFI